MLPKRFAAVALAPTLLSAMLCAAPAAEALPQPTGPVVLEITGGTGRFANASGTLTVTCVSGPPSQVGPLLVFALECKATGLISY